MADGATPSLVVLDMEFEEVRAELTLPAVARSVRGSYSGTVGAVVTDAGTAFVSSGVGVIDHTGPEYSSPHIHVYKSKPQILDFSLTSLTFAAAFEDRWAAVDGQRVVAFEEAPLIQNDVPELMEASLPGSASLAVPWAEGALATFEDGSETGVVTVDRDGAEVARESGCPSPSAMVRHGANAVLACGDDWWVLRPDGNGLSRETIAVEPSGSAPRSLAVHIDRERVLAAGEGGIAWVDGVTAGATSLDREICEVFYEDETAQTVLALSSDGTVSVLDAETFEVTASEVVTPSFSCDDEVRPRLAVSPRQLFITLPDAGALLVLDPLTLAERERYDLGGQPNHLAVLGVDPRNRNAGQCSTCDG